MTLGQLVDRLKQEPADKMLRRGLSGPHSYRGYHDELAFELTGPATVRQVLWETRGAIGQVFGGYKGGDFRMDRTTNCWVANYGECGETLGPILLDFLLNDALPPEEGR